MVKKGGAQLLRRELIIFFSLLPYSRHIGYRWAQTRPGAAERRCEGYSAGYREGYSEGYSRLGGNCEEPKLRLTDTSLPRCFCFPHQRRCQETLTSLGWPRQVNIASQKKVAEGRSAVTGWMNEKVFGDFMLIPKHGRLQNNIRSLTIRAV